jgi:predicted deacylase
MQIRSAVKRNDRILRRSIKSMWTVHVAPSSSSSLRWDKNRRDLKYRFLQTGILSLLSIVFTACSIPITLTPSPEVKHLDDPTGLPQSSVATQPANQPLPSETAHVLSTAEPSPTPTKTEIPFSSGPIVIGYSVVGRPLEVYQFGSGPIRRMIVAGIHGGYEWNTITLADQLITILPGRPDLVPQEVTLYILRSLNPDGEHRAHGIYGRANENGVDLNRNWPAYWEADWPRTGCWNYLPITAGPSPASEPETQALMQFLLGQHVDALINYHSAAMGIFPGGQPPDPASLSLAEAIAAASDYLYPPVDSGCQYTGQLIDWASLNGIAAIDIELSTHTSTDLRQNLRILTTFLTWRR